jgi:nucleoside-diphosphate-sugar epimerase
VRVLLTGAAGFIGSHLTERLLDRGDTVLGIDCLLEDSYSAEVKAGVWAELRGREGFEAVQKDLRTMDLRDLVAAVDVVVNEAGMTGLMRSWEDFRIYQECNVVALERLLCAASAAKVGRFVQISTSSVYGENAVGDERTATNPVSPYGATKLAAENLVHDYAANFRLPGIVLRYFSVYGPRQRPDMGYHKFCEALLAGSPLVVYGDGGQTRSNTFVSDCVEGTLEAIDGAAVGETYNIAGTHSIALTDAIAVLAEELDVRPVIEHRPRRPGDQLHTAGDTRKAASHFGYAPKVGPTEGLRIQAQWHRARTGRRSG